MFSSVAKATGDWRSQTYRLPRASMDASDLGAASRCWYYNMGRSHQEEAFHRTWSYTVTRRLRKWFGGGYLAYIDVCFNFACFPSGSSQV